MLHVYVCLLSNSRYPFVNLLQHLECVCGASELFDVSDEIVLLSNILSNIA